MIASPRKLAAVLAFALTALPPATSAQAQAVEEFYKKNQVTLITGYSSGGGFDTHARTVARFIGRHIPGSPAVVVQSMPGAGSLVATNHLYNIAAKDGSVIGMVRAPVLEPMIGSTQASYDATKFLWLGSGMSEFTVCALLGNPAIRTFDDATKVPFSLAGSGPGSDDDIVTRVLTKLFGLKTKIVTGYPGGAEMLLAVDRGEVDGRCGWSFTSIKLTRPEWIEQKKLKFLVSIHTERWPELPDTPSVMELAKSERERQILRLVVTSSRLGRPFLAPPGLPADRAAALRAAYIKTIQDPEYVAEVNARKEPPTLIDGPSAEALIREMFATPKDVLTEIRAMIAG